MGENKKILSTLCQWELISAEQAAIARERGAGGGGTQRKTNSASNIASNATFSTHGIWKEYVGVLYHPFSHVCLPAGECVFMWWPGFNFDSTAFQLVCSLARLLRLNLESTNSAGLASQ